MKAALITAAIVALSACSNETARTPLPLENMAAPSQVITATGAATDIKAWGSFTAYFTEDTHALKPVLVGVAKIEAGQQVHPPHRHVDEEYLMVTKGRGVWSLNGEDFEANEGDILFARPWDYHGIRAAHDSPLEFVVFKYSGKGVPAPTDPAPDLPEEAAP